MLSRSVVVFSIGTGIPGFPDNFSVSISQFQTIETFEINGDCNDAIFHFFSTGFLLIVHVTINADYLLIDFRFVAFFIINMAYNITAIS